MSEIEKKIIQCNFLKSMIKQDSYIQVEQENIKYRWLDMEYYDRGVDEKWNYTNGKYYYHKYAKNLNEFIGEMLADILNLPTAHYEPVFFHKILMIRTPDFRNFSYNYYSLYEYFPNESNYTIEEFIKKTNIDDESVDNILKMFALDIYMRQCDRSCVNIMIKEEKDSKRKSMAPLFDYSDSFYSKFSVYQNEIMDLKMVKESFQKDMMNYPKIYEYLKKMQEVDLIFLLSEFASKYNLNLTDEIKYYYAKEEERSKELIKKIM